MMRFNFKLLYLLVGTLLIFSSCKKVFYSIELNRLINKEVTLTKDLVLVQGINPFYNYKETKTKVIVWFSPEECSTCRLSSLGTYKTLEEYCCDSTDHVSVLFIFSPSEEKREVFKEVLDNSSREYPIFVDYNNSFGTKNDFLSKKGELHSFLLDSDNKIVLIGNPMLSNSMLELYKKKIDELRK